jgi:hypothetical protein
LTPYGRDGAFSGMTKNTGKGSLRVLKRMIKTGEKHPPNRRREQDLSRIWIRIEGFEAE